MAQLNAQTIANKWLANLQNAQQTMTQGVQAVTVAPGVAAAAQAPLMQARIVAAIQSGKWARNVAAVSLSQWQQAMIQTGIPRVTQGAQDKLPKVQAFLTKFLPFVANVKSQIAAMPNTTNQDKINRMIKNMQLMQSYQPT